MNMVYASQIAEHKNTIKNTLLTICWANIWTYYMPQKLMSKYTQQNDICLASCK